MEDLAYSFNSGSVMRVLDCLEHEEGYITPTEIMKKQNLSHGGVKNSVAFLDQLGMLEIITNGKTRMIRLKKRGENA